MSAQEILGSVSDSHSLKQIFSVRFTRNYRPKRSSSSYEPSWIPKPVLFFAEVFSVLFLFEAQASWFWFCQLSNHFKNVFEGVFFFFFFFLFFFFLRTARFIIATGGMLDSFQSPVTKYLSLRLKKKIVMGILWTPSSIRPSVCTSEHPPVRANMSDRPSVTLSPPKPLGGILPILLNHYPPPLPLGNIIFPSFRLSVR